MVLSTQLYFVPIAHATLTHSTHTQDFFSFVFFVPVLSSRHPAQFKGLILEISLLCFYKCLCGDLFGGSNMWKSNFLFSPTHQVKELLLLRSLVLSRRDITWCKVVSCSHGSFYENWVFFTSVLLWSTNGLGVSRNLRRLLTVVIWTAESIICIESPFISSHEQSRQCYSAQM
jgi:hypothetical protein